MKAFAGKHFLLIVENNPVPFDRRVWREACALRDEGAKVSVIAPAGSDTDKDIEIIDSIMVFRYGPRFSNGTRLSYIREYATAFLKSLALFHKVWFVRGRFEVVHVANPPDIFWPLGLYSRALGIAFIFDEHDLTPETLLSLYGLNERSGGTYFQLLKIFQYLSYRIATVVISTNETYRRKAIERDPRNRGKTFIVRNGPDTRYFTKVPGLPELRKGRGYLLAYIGIMAVQDGVDYIIRAVHYLVTERGFGDFIVYLIGSGDDIERLQNLTQVLKLGDKIIFTGRIPDRPALEILSTADICLSPDPLNPLNDSSTMNKIMEYMALGKPIVSFDLTEARYSAEAAALYVANNDPRAFGDGILELIGDPAKRRTMGEEGMRRVEQRLSWQRQIGNLIEAYSFALR